MNDYTPDKDGINHVNVYSKARTNAGRMLTNFSHSPFTHPLFGKFESVEGFWFWLASGKQYNKLRDLHGFKANQLGRIVCKNTELLMQEEEFKSHIKEAIKSKLRFNPEILKLLIETGELPLTHYYYDYNEIDLSKAKVKYLKKHEWQMDILMDLRKTTIDWMRKKRIENVEEIDF